MGSPDSPFDPTIALKDLDFLQSKDKFRVEGDLKRKLLDTIKKDVDFFAKCEIIDYSLLIGLHFPKQHPPPAPGTNNSVYLGTEQSQNEYNSPLHSAT
jgi:hypothetical protein